MIYIPEHFEASEETVLISDLVDQYNFATMVTVDSGHPVVSHIPFVYRPDEGPHGTLVAHIARANPQVAALNGGHDLLVIFQGPHAYVSPSWYGLQPDNVPTWNYAVVHMSGGPEIILEEDAAFAEMLTLVQRNDPGLSLGLSERDRRGLLKAIVVFKIKVTKVNAKFKMSQNRSNEDRRKVAEQLALGGADQKATAEFMNALGRKK